MGIGNRHDGGTTRARAIIGRSLLLLALLATPIAAADLNRQQRTELAEEAIRAFDRGAEVRGANSAEAEQTFREAAIKFQLLVDAGVLNGKLFYNLANACLESGQLGRAILNYRRAELLIPGDGRLEHNLQYARSLRVNQIETTGQRAFLQTLFFWHYGTSLRSRYLIGLFFYLAFWTIMIAGLWQPAFRRWYVLIPSLVLWLILGASVAINVMAPPRTEGVILADEVIVRKGNGERFEPQFKQKLNQGVEFFLLEQHRDWWQIELPDGKTGWIRMDQAEII